MISLDGNLDDDYDEIRTSRYGRDQIKTVTAVAEAVKSFVIYRKGNIKKVDQGGSHS